MSRILAYTSPGRGHLYPTMPILDELRRRGHQISLRTLESEVPLALSRGFRAAAISSNIEAIEHDDWRARNPRAALIHAMRIFTARAKHEAPDLRDAINEERPDALLIDINCWGALAAAEAWGGRWSSFCPYPLPLSSPDAPPFGPGLRPARGPLGRIRDRLMRPLVTGVFERAMLPPLNLVRRDIGLAPFAHADEIFRRPELLIYMTAEPFEYPRRDWPANVVMVGPCEWEPPSEVPAWVTAIKEPIVLITTSSEFQNDGRLVEAALQGLADEPVSVVVTMPAGDLAQFRIPANARIERFIPHGPLLNRAVCAVTHAGMGATQKALARGVPVCAVPFGRDQLEVARRVEIADAGTRLPAKRLNAERLRDKVREAMTKTAGAARIAAAFKAAGGPTAAADAFEARLLATNASEIGAGSRDRHRVTAGSRYDGKSQAVSSRRESGPN
jgi:UDP:flavonoid glycosyltransferase YjiC (YdhE family)